MGCSDGHLHSRKMLAQPLRPLRDHGDVAKVGNRISVADHGKSPVLLLPSLLTSNLRARYEAAEIRSLVTLRAGLVTPRSKGDW